MVNSMNKLLITGAHRYVAVFVESGEAFDFPRLCKYYTECCKQGLWNIIDLHNNTECVQGTWIKTQIYE